jgi:hypothetical protein
MGGWQREGAEEAGVYSFLPQCTGLHSDENVVIGSTVVGATHVIVKFLPNGLHGFAGIAVHVTHFVPPCLSLLC